MHGTNLYYGNNLDPMAVMRHSLALNRLITWFIEQAGYSVEDLKRLAATNFSRSSGQQSENSVVIYGSL